MSIRRKRNKPKTSKGKVRNVTPTKVDGFDFKSKLEAYCYQQLKASGIPFRYEQDSFILVDAFSFANDSHELGKLKGQNVFKKANPTIRAITYKPDFTNLDQNWVIECKGMMTDSFPIRWKLFKKYIHDNGLKYDLYMPRNRKQIDETINLIKSKNESNNSRRK
jgi:hypothetical protein